MVNLVAIKHLLGTFFDKIIIVKIVNIVGFRVEHVHHNKRFQHLCENLHIWLQNKDVAPKALACPNTFAHMEI
jgi:hypothetical protein